MDLTKVIIFLLFFFVVKGEVQKSKRYSPTWDSLDKRPLPQWYDQSKIGIFLHWGVFSVPSFRSEWFWWDWKGTKPQSDVVQYMKNNYSPDFTYAEFAPQFKADLFDPAKWASIFEASGAGYVVLTSKHHEGFCNWPSNYSWNWNSGDVGPHRDLVGELARAIRSSTKLHFGVYHSMFEWFNPLYLKDAAGGFKSQDFVRQKTMPELYELVQNYHPDVIWSDGDWTASDVYWNSTEFLAWLYNDSPVRDTVVVNDRWGSGTACKHGGYYTCADRYNPGHVLNHKWENCFTLDQKSWGYRRDATFSDYLSTEQVIKQVASTVSCGGNVLINVGPRSDGTIDVLMEERLRQLGNWLKTNGEAIYKSQPWSHQNDSMTQGVWYTLQNSIPTNNSVYAILLKWPTNGKLFLASVHATVDVSQITLVGDLTPNPIKFSPEAGSGVTIYLPLTPPIQLNWAWVLKMTGVKPTRS